jgi:DNA-directed RNA polymerase subunit RPC12/RpoP
MPRFTDPAPCNEGEQLYECTGCGSRFCRGDRVTDCPNCGERVENLTKARSE